ncbi:unnamed protein product [Schistosoma rodhaini]|nr:unnamed protein product [Schistosoma rodhaini]
MSLSKVSERAFRRRATVNLSRVLGCHRSTYNRRWNKLRSDFLRRHNLLSLSNFAIESTTTEINCPEIPSTIIPSTSCTNERLLEDNELYNNIDGLSMSRSSSQHLWPVLGRIVAPILSDVFMIGIYGGNTKPAQFNEISAHTISEIKEMTDMGLLSVRFNKYIAIKLTAVICDAPARSDVGCTVNHNGKAGCDRCVVNGRRLDGKMTFPNGEYTLRTDDSFRNQTQSIHHQGHSIFESLPIDMISTFPLDPMHMVYLGVIKKLVTLWIELGHKRLKNVNSCVIRTINKLISSCVESTPSEYSWTT